MLPYHPGIANTNFTISNGRIIPALPVKSLTWQADNKIFEAFAFINTGFKMNINASRGVFTGSFLDGNTNTTKAFSGVFLQKEGVNVGTGLFLGNFGSTGSVDVTESQGGI